MTKINEILRDVLTKIKPTKEERQITDKFVADIMETSSGIAKSYSAKPMLCGSVEKNTWLSNKNELDLFMLFDPAVPRKKLEEDGLKLAEKIITEMGGSYEKKYSEHPYLCGRIKFGNVMFLVDVVPCYDIKNLKKIKSAVDRTPHHVRFVKKNLSLPDEARLLKQFCKAAGVYGADVKTNGFSGYLCELLVIAHGKFYDCLKEARTWRAPTVVTIGNGSKEKLIKAFKVPLIITDPVDINRNVAAAVSVESFYKFIEAAKKFTDEPSEKFFFPPTSKPYTTSEIIKEIEKRGTRWYMIKFNKPNIMDDVLYPQMRRCANAVETILKEAGFGVMRKDFWVGDSCILVFEMDSWIVPNVSKNVGPNVYSKHAEDFLEHYKEYKIFLEGENWVVELDRKFTTVLHLLKDLSGFSELKLRERGIPSKIVSNFKNATLVSGADAFKMIDKSPEDFRIFLRNWFEKDIDIV